MIHTKQTFSSMYNLFILIGLSWQVFQVSILYFNFSVLTHLDIKLDENITLPDMSVCIAFYDILDRSRVSNVTSGVIQMKSGLNGAERQEEFVDIQSKIRIDQLFDLTPSEEETIHACSLRKPEAYDLVNFGYTNTSIDEIANSEVSRTKTPDEEKSTIEELNPCYEYFLVDKYSFMDSICYRFAYMSDLKVEYAKREIIFSPDKPGVLFSIQFKDSFNPANRIRVMMHPNDWLPWIEAAYTSYVFRLSGDGKVDANMFSVRSSKIRIKRLPFPYTTNCRNYTDDGFDDQLDCKQSCIKLETLLTYNKIPFHSRIGESSKYTRISGIDLNNKTMAANLILIQKKCSEACAQEDCGSVITSTDTTADPFDAFTMQYMTPIQSSLELENYEKMLITDYLVYVSSCLGIWLGVSVYGINPFVKKWNLTHFCNFSSNEENDCNSNRKNGSSNNNNGNSNRKNGEGINNNNSLNDGENSQNIHRVTTNQNNVGLETRNTETGNRVIIDSEILTENGVTISLEILNNERRKLIVDEVTKNVLEHISRINLQSRLRNIDQYYLSRHPPPPIED